MVCVGKKEEVDLKEEGGGKEEINLFRLQAGLWSRNSRDGS